MDPEAQARAHVKALEADLRSKQAAASPTPLPEEDYLLVLRACVEAADDVTARGVLQLMPQPPTLPAFNLLLHLHSKRGETLSAERVLAQVHQNGLEPSLTSYNTLLQAYVRRASRARRVGQEELKRVRALYASLRTSNEEEMRPDSYTLTAMLRWLQQATYRPKERDGVVVVDEKAGRLLELYQEVVGDIETLLPAERRSSQLYTALLGAASMVGDWGRVEETYGAARQQLKQGLMPSRAYSFVTAAYNKAMTFRPPPPPPPPPVSSEKQREAEEEAIVSVGVV